MRVLTFATESAGYFPPLEKARSEAAELNDWVLDATVRP
jgi:hypothetical protein